MKKRNEETIIKILHETLGKSTICDICRKHQITEQTFFRWRNK